MLYVRNSYKLWENLIRQTGGSRYINEKHIHKWIRELEQLVHSEYRKCGQAYLTIMTELALKEKTKKIPYALYEIYRYILTGIRSGEAVAISLKVFVEPTYVCNEEECEQLEKMIQELNDAYAHVNRKKEMSKEEEEQFLLQFLYKELEEGRESNRKYLEEEMKAARKTLWEQMLLELEAERKEAKKALEKEKMEARARVEQTAGELAARVKSTAEYQLRREEENRYHAAVAEDIERRMKFEEELCDSLHSVSGSFNGNMKSLTDRLIDSMQQIVEIVQEETGRVVDEMRNNTANAINQVVDTERKLRKDDFEPLLRNFAELQELVFYSDFPEEKIGLERTKISHYSRRFLKVLNRLGYEEYIPAQGETYDSYYHLADDEPADEEEYEVNDMIAYGFRRGEDVCLPAKVTIRKRVL